MARASGIELLKWWRGTRTKRAAADRIGLHESVYNRIENGRRKPTYDQARAIEDATGVPMRAWSDETRKRRAA